MKNLIIIGVGGVGREIALIVEQINAIEETWNLVGFIDDNSSNWGHVINGYSVMGGVDSVEFLPSDYYVIVGISN